MLVEESVFKNERVKHERVLFNLYMLRFKLFKYVLHFNSLDQFLGRHKLFQNLPVQWQFENKPQGKETILENSSHTYHIEVWWASTPEGDQCPCVSCYRFLKTGLWDWQYRVCRSPAKPQDSTSITLNKISLHNAPYIVLGDCSLPVFSLSTVSSTGLPMTASLQYSPSVSRQSADVIRI